MFYRNLSALKISGCIAGQHGYDNAYKSMHVCISLLSYQVSEAAAIAQITQICDFEF